MLGLKPIGCTCNLLISMHTCVCMKLSHHVLILYFYHVKGTKTVMSLVPITFGQDESLFLLTCLRICVPKILFFHSCNGTS